VTHTDTQKFEAVNALLSEGRPVFVHFVTRLALELPPHLLSSHPRVCAMEFGYNMRKPMHDFRMNAICIHAELSFGHLGWHPVTIPWAAVFGVRDAARPADGLAWAMPEEPQPQFPYPQPSAARAEATPYKALMSEDADRMKALLARLFEPLLPTKPTAAKLRAISGGGGKTRARRPALRVVRGEADKRNTEPPGAA